MKNLFLFLLVSVCTSGCYFNLPKGGTTHTPIQPANKEWEAQNKFQNSELAREFKANGISLGCYKSCLQITDAEISLLRSYKTKFFALKNKVPAVFLYDQDQVQLANSIGYTAYLPANVTSDQLDDLFQTITLTTALEESTSRDIFVSNTSANTNAILQSLINHPELLKNLPPADIAIEDYPSQYNRQIYKIRLNGKMNVADIEAEFAQIRLIEKLHRSFPGLREVILLDDQDGSLIETMIQNQEAVKSVIGSRKFALWLQQDSKHYRAFRTVFFPAPYERGTALHISSKLSLNEFLDLLRFEMGISDFSEELGQRIEYYISSARYDNFKACEENFAQLKTALLAKKDKIERISINSEFENMESTFKNGWLLLSCPFESVEKMKALIESIDTTTK